MIWNQKNVYPVQSQSPSFRFRYARLNYLKARSTWLGGSSGGANGAGPSNWLTNMLAMQVADGWRKFHEGEVFDFGSSDNRVLNYDFFPNQFPGVAGAVVGTRVDFEIEFSDNPFFPARIDPPLFIDGSSCTVNALNSTCHISMPPNVTVAGVQGLMPATRTRRIRIDNTASASALNILNSPNSGYAIIGSVPASSVVDFACTESITLQKTASTQDFYAQVFFEWL
jgi:hypothetical protein